MYRYLNKLNPHQNCPALQSCFKRDSHDLQSGLKLDAQNTSDKRKNVTGKRDNLKKKPASKSVKSGPEKVSLNTKPASKSVTNSLKKPRHNFRNIHPTTAHCVSHLVTQLDSRVRNELYSSFCIEFLRSYGFDLQLADPSPKSSAKLEGEWNLLGKTHKVSASCSLSLDLREHRNDDSHLVKPQSPNTVNLIINDVGFKSNTIKKLVESENPCIVMSVFDRTGAWQEEESDYQSELVQVEKCLHNQYWNSKIGFSTFRFNTETVTIPQYKLQHGLSLLLFNRALVARLPSLSAGKIVYQWPSSHAQQTSLTSMHQTTILVRQEGKKRDLYDIRREELAKVQLEQRRAEMERERVQEGLVRLNRPDIAGFVSSPWLLRDTQRDFEPFELHR